MVSVAQAIGHLPPIAAGTAHETVPNHRTRGLVGHQFQTPVVGEAREFECLPGGDRSRRSVAAVPSGCSSQIAETVLHRRVHADVSRIGRRRRLRRRCHSLSNGRFGHYDVNQVRALSLREAAILQSFPEDYVFYPDDEVEPVARMIGNAVPPSLRDFSPTISPTRSQVRSAQRERVLQAPAAGSRFPTLAEHSQTVATVQPAASRAARLARSRAEILIEFRRSRIRRWRLADGREGSHARARSSHGQTRRCGSAGGRCRGCPEDPAMQAVAIAGGRKAPNERRARDRCPCCGLRPSSWTGRLREPCLP